MQDAAHAFEEDDSGLRDEENNKRLKVATEREKEKTKMRERHRRSITTKILAGLRKHGNYDLPARADINDVLRALAMEAGWVVEADGTTYRNPALPQTFSCPDHPRLPDCMRMNRSSSNPGSSTLVSLTPVPSGSSLNSLKGFDCALPPFDIEAIDTAGGDCSATSSPGPISSAHVNLMQSDITHFLTAADEDTPLAHFTNPLSLGGFAGHYLLGNEVDLFNLQDDTTIAGAVAYHMTHAEEAKVLATRQSPPKTPAPRPSSFPMTSASLNHPHYGYHATNMGPYEYSCTTSLPSILSCTHPHPFLQESRASNQNTPIGSPQPHGGGF